MPRRHKKEEAAAAAAGAAAVTGAAASAAAPPEAAPAPPAPSEPVAPDLRVTVPPDKQAAVEEPAPVEHKSFVLTEAVKALDQEKPTKVKKKPAIIVGAAVLVGAVIAGVVVLTSGGGGSKVVTQTTTAPPRTTPTTPTTPTVPTGPELQPTAAQQVSIASAGPSLLVAAPGGAIQRLAAGTLAGQARTSDPAGPRAVSQSYQRVFVTDGDTITSLRLKDLGPLDAVAFPGGMGFAGGGKDALFALAKTGSGGQLCRVTPQAVSPCVSLPFAPAGAAVYAKTPSHTQVYVVDPSSGSVVPYLLGGGALSAGAKVGVGQKAHGSPVVIGSKLYVPVQRGIAVVDIPTGKLSTTVSLPATPMSLVAGPNGKLFAALFSANKVAIVDPASPAKPPVLAAAGKGPIALTTANGGVYLVNAAAGTVVRLDPSTGAPAAVSRLARSAVVPIRVGAPRITSAGRTVTVTVPLNAGALPASGLVVKSTNISNGQASAQLWQGGIKTAGGTKSGSGVAVRTTPGPGRVNVGIGVKAGDFTKVVVKRRNGGHSVVFILTQKPAPPPVTTTTPQVTQTTPPATQTTPPQTTTAPPVTHTTPPQTTTTAPPVTHTTPPQTTTHSTPPPPKTTTQTFTVS
jgi:hypothetical protein